jgi:hypothetical protein
LKLRKLKTMLSATQTLMKPPSALLPQLEPPHPLPQPAAVASPMVPLLCRQVLLQMQQ